MTLNRYCYVTNNPETMNDPSGDIGVLGNGYVYYVEPDGKVVIAGGDGSSYSNGDGNGNGNTQSTTTTNKSSEAQNPSNQYWIWLTQQNGGLSQTVGWIIGLIVSFVSVSLGAISNQLKAIIASGAIIVGLEPDIEAVLAATSAQAKGAAIAALVIDAWFAITMNANFWQSLAIFGIIGGQGIADVFTGGAAQLASDILGGINAIADTMMYFGTTMREYNMIYG